MEVEVELELEVEVEVGHVVAAFSALTTRILAALLDKAEKAHH